VENWGLSRNVVENKESYTLRAGILLKRKKVDGRWGKNRSQDSGLRIRSQGLALGPGRFWILDYARQPTAYSLPPSAPCRLPTAGSLLPLKSRRSGKRDLRYLCLLRTVGPNKACH